MRRGAGSIGSRGRPRPLAGAVERLQEAVAPPDLLSLVQSRWRAAVGGQIAEEAWPASERGGTVTVRCRSATWASELTMIAETLLAQLNESLEKDRRVRALKFHAGPLP
jgi:predicted nucleic acid-binding Zn ribbon protein